MSYLEQTYKQGYDEGYLEGYDRSRMDQSRRSDGGRAGTVCMSIAIWLMTGFAVAASIIELFGLA